MKRNAKTPKQQHVACLHYFERRALLWYAAPLVHIHDVKRKILSSQTVHLLTVSLVHEPNSTAPLAHLLMLSLIVLQNALQNSRHSHCPLRMQ